MEDNTQTNIVKIIDKWLETKNAYTDLEGVIVEDGTYEISDGDVEDLAKEVNEMVEKELDRLVTSFEVKNGIAPHLSPVRDFLKQYLLERKTK